VIRPESNRQDTKDAKKTETGKYDCGLFRVAYAFDFLGALGALAVKLFTANQEPI
jgi:hypothetical protein